MTLALGVSLAAIDVRAQKTTEQDVGETTRIDGFEMYYEVHGTGEPLVLLHGFTGSSADWAPIVPDSTREYRVIVPDLRGHAVRRTPRRNSPAARKK